MRTQIHVEIQKLSAIEILDLDLRVGTLVSSSSWSPSGTLGGLPVYRYLPGGLPVYRYLLVYRRQGRIGL